MKNTNKVLKIVGWVCVVIMLVLLVLQFLPYWTANDDTASIAEYLWNPAGYKKTLLPYFQELYNYKDADGKLVKWQPGDTVNPHLFILVSSILTILFTGFKNTNILSYLAPTIGGLCAGIGYLTTLALQLNSMWVVHMAICFVAFAVGPFGLIMAIKLFVDENKRKGLL